jgi:hypothetical protein
MKNAFGKLSTIHSDRIGEPMFQPPAASDCYDDLTTNIIAAFKRCNSLHELCGEMLATICVNRTRGHLTTADDATFDTMVTTWRKRWEES